MKFRKNLRAKKLASKGMAKAGFTLIELIVVIAILGILVLLAAPRFLGYTKDANVSTMQADAKVLSNAALVYNIENDTDWPTKGDDITVTLGDMTGVKVKALEQTKVSEHVQTLKGKLGDYALVTADATEGTNKVQVGDIVYVDGGMTDAGLIDNSGVVVGVEDRAGNTHFGVDVVKAR